MHREEARSRVPGEAPAPRAAWGTRYLVKASSSKPTHGRRGLGAVFTSGDDHVIRYADDAFCELVGERRDDLLDLPLATVLALDPSDRGWLDEVLASGVPAARSEIGLVRTTRAEESRRFFTAIASPAEHEGAAGGEPGLLVQVVDATSQVSARLANERAAREARLANEALLLAGIREHEQVELARDEAQRWNALVANLTEGVTVVDAAGRTLLVNPVGRRLLGMREGDPLEQDAAFVLETLAGERLGPDRRPVRRALDGERFTGEELVLVRPDGTRRRLVFSGSAVHDPSGQVVLAIAVYRDVTELRQLEQTREDYVALVTHDLRSPLQALLGHAHLLLGVEPNPTEDDLAQIERSARVILKVTQRLAGMVDDLYQSSQLESGNIELCREVTSLPSLVTDLCDRLGTAEDRARIVVDAAPGLPLVSVDVAKLERVLGNIVVNALKYSPPTSNVRIAFSASTDAVSVLVHDRGQGIAPADLPWVFEKYRRVASGSGRDGLGLGLGLYIARRIVEAHRGRVAVESVVGQGSTFEVMLPIGAEAQGS